MPLDTQQIDALRQSGAIFRAAPDRVSAQFYATLFAAHPEIRTLFPADLSDQGRKLAATLALVVDGIEDWERLEPVLAALARRHVGYGVKPDHYEAVGTALIQTLSQAGATPEQTAAWQVAIGRIAGFMAHGMLIEGDEATRKRTHGANKMYLHHVASKAPRLEKIDATAWPHCNELRHINACLIDRWS